MQRLNTPIHIAAHTCTISVHCVQEHNRIERRMNEKQKKKKHMLREERREGIKKKNDARGNKNVLHGCVDIFF